MPALTIIKVYELCNKHRWFTHGTNSQYDRMFDMVRQSFPVHDIATAIWICSDPEWSVKEIESILIGGAPD